MTNCRISLLNLLPTEEYLHLQSNDYINLYVIKNIMSIHIASRDRFLLDIPHRLYNALQKDKSTDIHRIFHKPSAKYYPSDWSFTKQIKTNI